MKALKTLAAALATLALTACVVHKADAPPPLSGPSGAATSITVTANPDSIGFDGGSMSTIVITALGVDGRALPNLPLRVDMFVNGLPQDFGTLSARTVVTDANGIARVAYTAPPTPPGSNFGTCRGLAGTCVEIVATPIGTSFESASSHSVNIRLVPPGVILPPGSTPAPCFLMSPVPVVANSSVQFTAGTLVSSVCQAAASDIQTFDWTFGDGSSGAGRVVSHTFNLAGTFSVTLTETSDRGVSQSTTQPVTVGSGSLPTPAFTFSPAAPNVNDPVFFNAATSTPGPGHTIVTYRWTFGDGATGLGATVTHAFAVARTYIVQLTVTDEAGQSVTSGGTPVTIGGGGNPTAILAVTNLSGRQVRADGSSSTAVGGSTIASYTFQWGDTPPTQAGPGPASVVTNTYVLAGTYTVRLIVVDSLGRTGTTTQSVVVP